MKSGKKVYSASFIAAYGLIALVMMLGIPGLFSLRGEVAHAQGCTEGTTYGSAAPAQICTALEDALRRTGAASINDMDDWDWSFEVYPNSGMGCPQAFASVESVPTRAYNFVFIYQGITYDYRMTQDKSRLFLCSPGGAEDVALPVAAPVQTAVPMPTSTQPAVALPPFEAVLFSDDFSANLVDWEVVRRNSVTADLLNDAYSIDYTADAPSSVWLVSPGMNDWAKAPYIQGDFEAEVEVKNIQSSTGEYRLSLLFGLQNDYERYQVINLYPAIWYWSLGNEADYFLQEGIAAGAPVNFADGQPHRIGVRVVSSTNTVSLLVDGLQVANSTYAVEPGSIGFGIGSVPGDIATVHAEFDNLIIRGEGDTQILSVAAPTPTVIPQTSTGLNLPEPVYSNVIFEDTFEDNTSKWETANTDLTFSDVTSGVYLIEHTTQRTGFGWFIAAGYNDPEAAPQLEAPYEVEVQVSNVQSNTGNYRLTMVVGVEPDYQNYTTWNIYMPAGTWAVGNIEGLKLREGNLTQPLPDLTTGVHTLGIQVEANQITLLVDRMPVATVQDILPLSGTIGFGVGSISGETSTVSATFDNLQVRQPGSQE